MDSPTSTPTATSPPRVSCPATASRACRSRPSSRAARAQRMRRVPAAAALPRHQRVRTGSPHLPRGRSLPGQPRHASPRRTTTTAPAQVITSEAKVRRLRLPAPASRPGSMSARPAAQPLDGSQWLVFRLQNVITRRRDRISADEEERNRSGLRGRTAVPIRRAGAAPPSAVPSREATAVDGSALAEVTYGDAATHLARQPGLARRRPTDAARLQSRPIKGAGFRTDEAGDDDRRTRPTPGRQDQGPGPALRRGPSQHRCSCAGADRRQSRNGHRFSAPSNEAIEVSVPARGLRARREPLPRRGARGTLMFCRGGGGWRRRASSAGTPSPQPSRERRTRRHSRSCTSTRHGAEAEERLRARLLRLPAHLRQPARPRALDRRLAIPSCRPRRRATVESVSRARRPRVTKTLPLSTSNARAGVARLPGRPRRAPRAAGRSRARPSPARASDVIEGVRVDLVYPVAPGGRHRRPASRSTP